jgi:prepilin-type N-terminal cleavage/methylation domain-containing protein
MRARGGFTLLEVLMTILLLSGAFVALSEALSIGIFSGTESESQLVALNLAQEKMEYLRSGGFANILNETRAAVGGFPAFGREVVVATPQAGLKQVNVAVYWAVKQDTLNVSLATYMADKVP